MLTAPESGSTAFLIVDPDSNLARAYGVPDPTAEDSLFSTFDQTTSIAVPIAATSLTQVNTFVDDNASILSLNRAPTSVLLDSSAVTALSLIDRDLAEFGVSARGFRVSPYASEEDISAALEVFSSTSRSAPQVLEHPNDIAVEITPNSVIQTATGGTCGADPSIWPMDVGRVGAIIRENLDLLGRVGIRHVPRTEIMVVDSGLPEDLARSSEFEPFLHRNRRAQLSAGAYVVNTQLATDCHRQGRPPYSSVFGYIVESGRIESCINQEPYMEIAPPFLDSPPVGYLWDHGGFVGVLAVGGPGLIAANRDHESLIGISFARVMRLEDGQVRSDVADIREAFEFGAKTKVPILNASLRVNQSFRDIIVDAFNSYSESGLLVAAAGNTGRELEFTSSAFPAVIAAPEPNDSLVIVGGVQPNPTGTGMEIWPESSFSNELVDIAAPAVRIASLNGRGQLACYTGTSVAAPQVSFTAGLLHAFGMTSAAEIKRRILATADTDASLAQHVRDGRILNIPAALDIFADLIWRRGQGQPERVRLLPPDSRFRDAFLRVCDSAATTLPDGWIDVNRLYLWERRPDGTARVWHDISKKITGLDNHCNFDEGHVFAVLMPDGSRETIEWSELDRLVPSRFRNVLNAFPEALQ